MSVVNSNKLFQKPISVSAYGKKSSLVQQKPSVISNDSNNTRSNVSEENIIEIDLGDDNVNVDVEYEHVVMRNSNNNASSHQQCSKFHVSVEISTNSVMMTNVMSMLATRISESDNVEGLLSCRTNIDHDRQPFVNSVTLNGFVSMSEIEDGSNFVCKEISLLEKMLSESMWNHKKEQVMPCV